MYLFELLVQFLGLYIHLAPGFVDFACMCIWQDKATRKDYRREMDIGEIDDVNAFLFIGHGGAASKILTVNQV